MILAAIFLTIAQVTGHPGGQEHWNARPPAVSGWHLLGYLIMLIVLILLWVWINSNRKREAILKRRAPQNVKKETDTLMNLLNGNDEVSGNQ